VSGQVVHTTKNSSGSVTGIAVLDDRMYVSSWDTPQVAVYCPTTFQRQSILSFICEYCRGQEKNAVECRQCYAGMLFGHMQDYGYTYYPPKIRHMVGCGVNKCLYASGHDRNSIYKVAIGRQNNTLSSWSTSQSSRSTGRNPQGLSVTSSHNLLVVFSNSTVLNEYSTDGDLIREINFQLAGISVPVHAVQLSNDRYAVVHHRPRHQLSVVSSDGQLVQSYCGDAGNMNEPRGFAVYQAGRMFVADQNNNRILVVNCKTLSAFQLPTDCRLNGPYSIHCDSASRRLYIGEWNGGRIVCCKL